MDALTLHRLHFAFTITFHYLFPQLTMGLALLILVLKTMALRTGKRTLQSRRAILGQNLRRQFRRWAWSPEFPWNSSSAPTGRDSPEPPAASSARPSRWKACSPSSWNPRFLGVFLFGEKRLAPKAHWFAAFLVFLGSWLSGFFIIATNAWMQHPVGYASGADGAIVLTSFCGAASPTRGSSGSTCHNMIGAVVTGAFVMASVGAFYLLSRRASRHTAASSSAWA